LKLKKIEFTKLSVKDKNLRQVVEKQINKINKKRVEVTWKNW